MNCYSCRDSGVLSYHDGTKGNCACSKETAEAKALEEQRAAIKAFHEKGSKAIDAAWELNR